MSLTNPTRPGVRSPLVNRLLMSAAVIVPNPASKRDLDCTCRPNDPCARCSQQRLGTLIAA